MSVRRVHLGGQVHGGCSGKALVEVYCPAQAKARISPEPCQKPDSSFMKVGYSRDLVTCLHVVVKRANIEKLGHNQSYGNIREMLDLQRIDFCGVGFF